MREPSDSTFMLELVLIHPYVDMLNIQTWTWPSMHAHQGNYDMARSMLTCTMLFRGGSRKSEGGGLSICAAAKQVPLPCIDSHRSPIYNLCELRYTLICCLQSQRGGRLYYSSDSSLLCDICRMVNTIEVCLCS